MQSSARTPSPPRRGPAWTRLGLQAGLLAGLGAAALIAPAQRSATAADEDCPQEDLCTFKKPVFMIIMDYSTSMNSPFGDPMDEVTRWESQKSVVQTLVESDMDFLSKNMLVGLMRFGHDPEPALEGTTIVNDPSGIIDGQAVDVLWYDEGDSYAYQHCDGQEIVDSLAATPAPINGNLIGIGTWTDGALQRSRELMELSYEHHPEDAPSQEDRAYLQMLLTDGEWTDPDGDGQSPEHDPAVTAAALFNDGIDGLDDDLQPVHVPTYVVYFGELGGDAQALADELASAGGTEVALTADEPIALLNAVQSVIQDIKDQVVLPSCIGGLPRVMVIADASSSMLNADGGPAPKGMSGWDQTRYALAGDPDGLNQSLFEQELLDPDMMPAGLVVEDLVYLGLTVFGHNSPAPGEQKLLVQYGACRQDNFYWALSPEVSHPGCPDYDYSSLAMDVSTPMREIITGDSCDAPWAGAPINWSFPSVVGGQPGPLDDPDGPGFADDTYAHMPRCDEPGDGETVCSGSGTYTHLGLQLVKQNQAAYHAQATLDGEVDEATSYINLLITDGQYSGYSTDAQVQAELEAMFNAGIPTFVIGLGAGVNSPQAQEQLGNMASWGGTGEAYDADNQAELELALKTIIESVSLDPCCHFNDCSDYPEPTDGSCAVNCIGCQDDYDCEIGESCVKPMDSPFGSCEPLEGCEINADCVDDPDTPTPEACVDGECVPGPCKHDSHCDTSAKPPEICQGGVCIPGPCLHPVQCPDGTECVDKVCVPVGCLDDGDCPGDEKCVLETGECRPPTCSEKPALCTPDESCVDGVCTPVGDDDDDDDDDGSTSDGDASAGPGDGEGDTETDSDGPELEDEGCGCSGARDPGGRDLLGLALLLSLARRRRRRRALDSRPAPDGAL